ncbi:MAG: DUF5606 domain-containing protein [Bacteroidales bacterium]|nr:DUF5606 domain-containing protein [Bacteroidales bacterium]
MLKDILSISGHSGLFKLVAQSTKSIIVESLETHQKMPVYYTNKVSALEDIAIFTEDEEIPLEQIFEKIYKMENKQKSPANEKSTNDEIKDYFSDILPDYDKERVYVSDMKKVLKWYNILLSQNILNFDEKKKEEKKAAKTDEKSEAKAETKEVKKAPAKKTAKAAEPKSEAKPKKTATKKAAKKDE